MAVWAADQAVGTSSASLADPQSILDGRSPGERDAGALAQTKEAYPMLNDASPMPKPPVGENLIDASPLPSTDEVPRAFAAIVPPEETAGGPGIGLPGNGFAIPLFVPSETGGTPGLSDRPVLGAPAVTPLVLNDVPAVPVTPILGGSSDLTGPTVLTGPSTSGVPEPASWATMIVGFLTIGTVVRRKARSGADTLPEAA